MVKNAVVVSLIDALKLGPPPAGNLAIPIYSHGTMEVEVYQPISVDRQSPHPRDEIYLIAKGNGVFFNGIKDIPVHEGSFIFVPAETEHRFKDFSDDFTVWVIFYGPIGGESIS